MRYAVLRIAANTSLFLSKFVRTLIGPFFLTPTPNMLSSLILGLKAMPVAGSVMAA